MSLLKKLEDKVPTGWKKAAGMAALGATALFSPMAEAKTEAAPEAAPAGARMEQRVSAEKKDNVAQGWTWDSSYAREVYESLPDEYKVFAGKDFIERTELKEYMEQRDWIKRDKKRQAVLDRNPDAKVGDLFPHSTVSNEPLTEFKTGTLPYSVELMQAFHDGKLTQDQYLMASQLADLGRPLATLDKSKSYVEQLRDCGFAQTADVMGGKNENDLTPREHAIFVAEMTDPGVEQLRFLTQGNEDAHRAGRIRMAEDDEKRWQAEHSFFGSLFATKTRVIPEGEMKPFPVEEINGKTVKVPQPNEAPECYSFWDEVIRGTAEKIAREDANAAALQKAKADALSAAK